MRKILIFGSGSVGTFLGVKLFASGNDVQLLGKRKVSKIGDFIEINGEKMKLPSKIESLSDESFYDVVFCATKLYDTQNAIQELKNHRIKFENIVFVQNGLVDEDFYGEWKNHKGFCTISIFEGFRLEGDKLTAHKSKLGWQVENSSAGMEIVELLNEAGITATSSSELSEMRAEKMILVTATSPLSALYKKPMGELMNDEVTKNLVDKLILESYQVLKDDYSLSDLEEIRENVYETIRMNEQHYSSMYQDVMSGRKTEIDFLNGRIIEIGKKKGIETPINEMIFEKIKEFEKSSELLKETIDIKLPSLR